MGAKASLVILLLSLGCAATGPKKVDLPPPTEATTLGVGDKFELRIVGEEEKGQYEVFPDGTSNLPYINRLQVEGLEPHEVASRFRQVLIDQQFFKDPVVTLTVLAYASKRIEVGGEVKKPGSFPMEPGMTLVRAIALAGGLTPLADESDVTIRRKLKNGKVKRARVDYDDILDNRINDVPLQAGDSVNVAQSAL